MTNDRRIPSTSSGATEEDASELVFGKHLRGSGTVASDALLIDAHWAFGTTAT